MFFKRDIETLFTIFATKERYGVDKRYY